MQLKEVKVGGLYSSMGAGKVIVESIEKADRSKGIMQSGAICKSLTTGQTHKIYARYLTPWEEHETQQRMNDLQEAEAYEQVERIIEAVGYGAETNQSPPGIYTVMLFTEQAADRVLELCEANPIPGNRRPSLAPDQEQWVKRASLLGQRLRRAIGVGYAGSYAGHILNRDGQKYQAQVAFYGEELKQAADRLAGAAPQTPNPLAELLG